MALKQGMPGFASILSPFRSNFAMVIGTWEVDPLIAAQEIYDEHQWTISSWLATTSYD
jgi:hypothetical protein